MDTNGDGNVNTGLHNRSATVAATEETSPSPRYQEEINPNPHSYSRLDEALSWFYSMRNRAKIVNGSIIAGTASIFVAAYSSINFFIILLAPPELIAKIRFLKFGMSVSGSACMFLNAICIFILCVEMKYAIEHYTKPQDTK